jgi:DNA polymerase-3 subunit gamma/tau
MSYQVLARKWRPQSFRDLIGQEHVSRTLENAIREKRIAHAYLFSGMRGVGKTSVARILAKTLNCENPRDSFPCQECAACKEITAGSYVDVLEIDGASNTGVDNVRELQENVKYAPLKGKYKIYIIDEVHMLSKSAFNALLKTLEEPPPDVLFIFATTESSKIPATILCRCQHFHFHRLGYSEVMERLRFILREEGISFPERSLALIAKASEGGLRDALTLLDQILAYTGVETREEDVISILGMADHFLYPFLQYLLERNGTDALRLIQKITEGGFDLRQFCAGVVESFRNLMVIKLGADSGGLLDLPEEEITLLKRRSEQVEIEEIQRLYTLFLKALEEMRWAPTPRFSLEVAAIRAVRVTPLRPVEELIRRLDELQNRLGGQTPVFHREEKPADASRRVPFPDPVEDKPDADDGAENSGVDLSIPPAPTSGDASSGTADRWRQVIRGVSSKKPSLESCLVQTVPLGIEDGALMVEVHGGTFCMDLVRHPGNLNAIKAAVRTVFQTVGNVRFTIPSTETGKVDKVGPEEVLAPAVEFEQRAHEKKSAEVKDAFGEDALVQEALRLFGGKVMEIHPREHPPSSDA